MGFYTPDYAKKTVASIMLKKEGQVKEPSFWKRSKSEETGKREPTECLGTVVAGRFKNIQIRQITEDMQVVEITLEDENGEYVVSGSWTQIMRNIVNSLAGTAQEFKIENVSIGLYEKAGKDGKLYARCWIKNNEYPTSWLYSIEEQEGMKKEVEFKNKKMIDWSIMEKALVEQFDAINGNKIDVSNDQLFGEDIDHEVEAKEKGKKEIKKEIEEDEVLEF